MELIERFLAAPRFAVVGASADRSKYGNKVLRAYLQAGREVIPVNPKGGAIEGLEAVRSLAELPVHDHAVSIITPPTATVGVVRDAADSGHRMVWMQPGAESEEAVELARSRGLDVVHGGPCVLVALGFRG